MSASDPKAPLDDLTKIGAGGAIIVPDTWQQGRGTFGGLVVAYLARALEESAPGRALRSLTTELCGPLQPGAATIELETLRAGSAVTTTAARLVQDGAVQAHAVGVLGLDRTRERDGVVMIAPEIARPWLDVPPLPMGTAAGGPPFSEHFEFRNVGALPFSGGEVGAEGWIRPKNPGKRRDASYLAACIDAYWPAIFPREPMPRPMATIAFTFQPTPHFDGLDPDAPLYYRARLLSVDAGYCVEHRELWGADGRLLALNQQTFVIIK